MIDMIVHVSFQQTVSPIPSFSFHPVKIVDINTDVCT